MRKKLRVFEKILFDKRKIKINNLKLNRAVSKKVSNKVNNKLAQDKWMVLKSKILKPVD
jgi:hypothetical protein